ncbi:MAG: DNA mismatch repair endonuclease MutL [Acholeplasmatales bacterium]|jgi:DNA mismatch repair protein MutL|nr:DNA mismatch repair endonuclease MutL [Acholeplasmatales bacterium]
MGKIAKMTPKLANMIAAGEVVEKPSSVVKELVENSIDANAKHIRIYLLDGGLKEIKIVDDGEGMDEEDVRLAFLPHATSKIKSEYDLTRILSLGFRGEAIASIAAVSKMQILSSQDGVGGYQVTYQAGSLIANGKASANKGTTVIVKNLFFNTPARLKYLKSAKSELASITYLMDRMAIAHPSIRFTVVNDNKTYLSTTASNKAEALMGEIYGLEVAKSLIETRFCMDGVLGRILLVKPEIYRANKLEITLIVNGRYVKNYAITNAIIAGYSTYIPIGKYPIAVLYLEIDPIQIDVNIHPAKTEIKISNQEEILKIVIDTISKALKQASLIPTRSIPVQNNTMGYRQETIFALPRTRISSEPKLSEEAAPYAREELGAVEEEAKPKVSEQRLPQMEYVGQAFGTYLLFQNEKGLYLMDQHAAAERINYEKYYELLGNPQQPTSELLFPLSYTFTRSEALYLEEHIEDLRKLGFEVEPIGNEDFALRRVPLWAKLENAEDILYQILKLFIENKKIDVIAFRDKIAKQISCKGSIKANHALNRIEIDALYEQLSLCKNPFTCPHGRPTIIHFTIAELERMFERIQS